MSSRVACGIGSLTAGKLRRACVGRRRERQLQAEIDRLRHSCAEVYQAVGAMADALGYWENKGSDLDPITKVLDNLSAAANGDRIPHSDLLPFSLSNKVSI